MLKKTTIYLALGSNLGNKEQNIRHAIDFLKKKIIITKIAPLLKTEPLHIIDQPKFINTALKAKTNLSPYMLLKFIKLIERKMGRTKTIRFSPRIIDIDILYYGNLKINTPDLIIPHPRIEEREFVKKSLRNLK